MSDTDNTTLHYTTNRE